MVSLTLPLLPLPYPLVLLPHCGLSVVVDRPVGQALLELRQLSDAEVTVAAVPAVSAPTSAASGDGATATALYDWATVARVSRMMRNPVSTGAAHSYIVLLQGASRVRVVRARPSSDSHALGEVDIEALPAQKKPSLELVEQFRSAALTLLARLAKDASHPAKRARWLKLAETIEEMGADGDLTIVDRLIGSLNGDFTDRLDYLASATVEERFQKATRLVVKQSSIMSVERKIASDVNENLSKQQKEYYLRQQLAAIQRELHSLNSGKPGADGDPNGAAPGGPKSELDDDEQADADDLAELKAKIEALEPGSEEKKTCVREWRRMKRIQPSSVEHGVIRSYLEWVTAVPWPTSSSATAASEEALARVRDKAFLTNAKTQLDADHFGLEKIKRRLIEYLAIVRLKQLALVAEEQKSVAASASSKAGAPAPPSTASSSSSAKKRSVRGPILLFVGPPGVGKTSLGQSVANALQRPFQRISLGGVRDEAEIRGHRRTYVASGPGLIVQALRKAGRPDPVILLDEIDKVGQSNFHGDPSAALLEVLDPEQNHSFNDHYINVPIDLSQVLFICTSNTLDTISAPLLDRCELIQLSGYTHDEKIHIARRFLLPKQLKANGLDASKLTLTDPAMLHIVTHYTREAGVRSLERSIGAVVRHKALEYAEHQDAALSSDEYRDLVEVQDLEKILGIPWWTGEDLDREEKRGVVYGLVVTGLGEGGILPVETSAVPGSGHLRLTGSLGDVIKESGEIALSWVKGHAYNLGITAAHHEDPLKIPNAIDIHLHLPSGAQKKDGPSAGIAMVCAFVSLLTGLNVPTTIAMTGEVTLRGRVGPVGGIKEKVLGAHRAQVKKLILPWANRKDVEHDVAPEIRNAIQFVFARTVEEVLEAAFGKGRLRWRKNSAIGLESRL